LGGRKRIRPIKTEWWDAGMVRYRFAYGQLMPLPLPLAPVNSDWFYLPGFTFLVPAHLDTSRQNPESHKMVIAIVV